MSEPITKYEILVWFNYSPGLNSTWDWQVRGSDSVVYAYGHVWFVTGFGKKIASLRARRVAKRLAGGIAETVEFHPTNLAALEARTSRLEHELFDV